MLTETIAVDDRYKKLSTTYPKHSKPTRSLARTPDEDLRYLTHLALTNFPRRYEKG